MCESIWKDVVKTYLKLVEGTKFSIRLKKLRKATKISRERMRIIYELSERVWGRLITLSLCIMEVPNSAINQKVNFPEVRFVYIDFSHSVLLS